MKKVKVSELQGTAASVAGAFREIAMANKEKPMSHKITINREDDEHIEFLIDGESVGSANHDNDGWAGMETAENLVTNIAIKLGFEIEETFGGEDDEEDN